MDLISRQAAIEALNSINGTAELDEAFFIIENLPPAQPELCDDAISRKALIEALMLYQWRDEEGFSIDDWDEKRKWIEDWLPDLPSAQPEIIRCKDCRWYGFYSCELHGNSWMRDGNGYCDRAERRIDE